jgi:hypothetical protein
VVEAGETVSVLPVPAAVPPQEDVYHLQLAPTPKLPPEGESVVEVPTQMVVVPLIEVAGLEESKETMIFLAHTVESQLLLARTKNESVADMSTVIDVPVPTNVLPAPNPQPPLNHCHAAPTPSDPPFTVRVTEVP